MEAWSPADARRRMTAWSSVAAPSRWRATSVRPRVCPSPRSRTGLVARPRRSRRTSTTHLMLTKDLRIAPGASAVLGATRGRVRGRPGHICRPLAESDIVVGLDFRNRAQQQLEIGVFGVARFGAPDPPSGWLPLAEGVNGCLAVASPIRAGRRRRCATAWLGVTTRRARRADAIAVGRPQCGMRSSCAAASDRFTWHVLHAPAVEITDGYPAAASRARTPASRHGANSKNLAAGTFSRRRLRPQGRSTTRFLHACAASRGEAQQSPKTSSGRPPDGPRIARICALGARAAFSAPRLASGLYARDCDQEPDRGVEPPDAERGVGE